MGALSRAFRFGGYAALTMVNGTNRPTKESVLVAGMLQLIGPLTAPATLVLPDQPGAWWLIVNNTTGGYPVTAKGTGKSVALPANAMTWVATDGVDFRLPIPIPPAVVVAYAPVMAIDASLGNIFQIIATNATAFTISTPLNPTDGQVITFDLKNTSGGALGAITLGAGYLVGQPFPSPVNTKRRTISFYYNATAALWIELNRAQADM